jgi:hypothetical protein
MPKRIGGDRKRGLELQSEAGGDKMQERMDAGVEYGVED